MKENKLARTLGITKEEAKRLMEQYLDSMPAVKSFFGEVVAEAQQSGFSFTMLGRRRFHPSILSHNDMDRWGEERKVGNTVVQGSAADVVKLAMINCHEDTYLRDQLGARMLLQVHDELVFECPTEHAVQVKEIVQDWMEHALPTALLVPLNVSLGIGQSWMEAK